MEVEIISKESIKPSSPTPNHLRTFDLSILDQLINLPYVPIIFYYPNYHKDNDIFQALQRSLVLKKSLSETLTQFYPLAGTIKDKFSVDSNDVGANYVLALVHGSLYEFMHKPDHGLIKRFLPFEPSFDDSCAGPRVTHVQVNIFKCGGIAVGLCVLHKILDGASLFTFLKGWANTACRSEEVIYPNLTSPLTFPVESLWLRDVFVGHYQRVLKEGNCVTKRFVFGLDSIAGLKTEAIRNGVQQPTRVEVVSALLWKCAIAASKEACSFQKTSRLTHFVNLRRKLEAKMSKDLIGNMIWISNAVCKANDEITLHGLVNEVHDSIARVSGEFLNEGQSDEWYAAMLRLLQQMGEAGSVGPIEYYTFTSWCKMGFYDIDFGWGKPSWVSGLIGHGDGIPVFMNFVTLMDTKCGDGIEAWVILDEEEMKILQRNHELLAYALVDASPIPNDQ